MKNLTVTTCLTLALLLGSAGMLWSAYFRSYKQQYNIDTLGMG